MHILLIFYVIGAVHSKKLHQETQKFNHEHEQDDHEGHGAHPCRGGKVDEAFLEDFAQKDCTVISGDLEFRSVYVTEEALLPLARITKIEHGALIFEDNVGIESLSFLSALEEIDNSEAETPAIQIGNNEGLMSIGLTALQKVSSGGSGPIIQIYSTTAIPEEEGKRFQELTGGRYQMYFHSVKDTEGSDDSSLVVVAVIIIAAIIMAVVAVVIILMVLRKKSQKKGAEGKRPDVPGSAESKEIHRGRPSAEGTV